MGICVDANSNFVNKDSVYFLVVDNYRLQYPLQNERIGSIRQVARSLKINRKVLRIWIRNKVIIYKF